MSKKIVISPCFNELHFLKHRIPNVCEYLQPDYCILADGMFPNGPENQTEGKQLKDIVENYTLDGKGKLSFDYRQLEQFIQECANKYPKTKFALVPMDYKSNMNHDEVYKKSYNLFREIIKVDSDDLIFPLECDVFLTKDQADLLLSKCEKLKPNHSLMSDYYQFFEFPMIAMHTKRYRRLAYKYGDGSVWGCYERFDYSHDSTIRAFHYEWIRPDKYFNLRLLQLQRSYTPVIKELRDLIRSKPSNLSPALDGTLKKLGSYRRDLPLTVSDMALTDHPKHFRDHESFRYYNE